MRDEREKLRVAQAQKRTKIAAKKGGQLQPAVTGGRREFGGGMRGGMHFLEAAD